MFTSLLWCGQLGDTSFPRSESSYTQAGFRGLTLIGHVTFVFLEVQYTTVQYSTSDTGLDDYFP
jgi:hypothetical protein